MLLQPKKSKYNKLRKGRLARAEFRPVKLQFGIFGLKSLESGSISAKQIEAARQAITRKMNRNGHVWIRVFPDLPITKKPVEVRMGKGKGSFKHWSAKIRGGSILFEIDGVSEKLAFAALRTGGAKLPVKTVAVS